MQLVYATDTDIRLLSLHILPVQRLALSCLDRTWPKYHCKLSQKTYQPGKGAWLEKSKTSDFSTPWRASAEHGIVKWLSSASLPHWLASGMSASSRSSVFSVLDSLPLVAFVSNVFFSSISFWSLGDWGSESLACKQRKRLFKLLFWLVIWSNCSEAHIVSIQALLWIFKAILSFQVVSLRLMGYQHMLRSCSILSPQLILVETDRNYFRPVT